MSARVVSIVRRILAAGESSASPNSQARGRAGGGRLGDGMGARRAGTGRRGFGLVEILVVLAVLALAGVLLVRYVGSTQQTVEKFQRDRPLANARLMADRATLEMLAGLVRNYQA